MPEADYLLGTKICSSPNCDLKGLPQPLDRFYRSSTSSDGLRGECKRCEHRRRGVTEAGLPKDPLGTPQLPVAKELQQNKIIEAVKKSRSSPKVTPLEEVAAHLMRAWGGPEEFANDIVGTAQNAPPGHKIKLMQLAAGLFKDASAMQSRSLSDLSMMDEKDLDQLIAEAVDQRLRLAMLTGEAAEIDGEVVDAEYEKDVADHLDDAEETTTS